MVDSQNQNESKEEKPEPLPPEYCWCGGRVVDGVCSNADPNEVGP